MEPIHSGQIAEVRYILSLQSKEEERGAKQQKQSTFFTSKPTQGRSAASISVQTQVC